MDNATTSSTPRVLGPLDGEVMGPMDGVRDRFMIGRNDSGGRFSLVEHLFAPRVLAAPLHLHTLEDEYSYVLEGRIGALLGEHEVVAEAGHLIFKPRHQWHTFWNAGDAPARVLEIISPSGLDELFREMGTLGDALDPEMMATMAARYGCTVDFDGTMPIVERHGLRF
jgi:quercetin dioxygenase-like cupin family protein